MNEAAANKLVAEAEQAVTDAEFTVGRDVRVAVGASIDGGAAALLELSYATARRAPEVVAALEDHGLTAVPHTKVPTADSVEEWLQNRQSVEVRWTQAA